MYKYKIFFCLLFLGFIIKGCQIFEVPEEKSPVHFYKGISNLNYEISCLINPKGIIPDTSDFQNYSLYPNSNNVFRMTTINYHSFFIFDEKTILIILSYNPVYFIKIISRDFYWHLNQEYEQIKSGIRGNEKRKNSDIWFKSLGKNYDIGIAFTPNEVYYLTSGINRYRIRNLWQIYNASSKVTLFEPNFHEEQILNDFNADIINGKNRNIFTYSSNLLPVNYDIIYTSDFKFGFLIAENLILTSDLRDNITIYSTDKNNLTRDTAIFFTIPLGNSKGGSNYLNIRDGIVVILRGNLTDTKYFFQSQGFDISERTERLNVNISEDENSGKININWLISLSDVNIKIYSSLNGIDYNLVHEQNTSGAIFNYPVLLRGYMYRIIVKDNVTGKSSNPRDIIIAKDPDLGELIFTEFLWMGSSTDSTSYTADEFMEIKNISPYYIRIKNIEVRINRELQISSADFKSIESYYKILTPGEYFVIANYKDRIFNEQTPGFNLTNRKIKHLVKSSVLLPNTNFTAEIYRDNILIDSILIDVSLMGLNGTLNERSAVKLSDNVWGTSTSDIGVGAYLGHTFCSPGFGSQGEK